MVEHIIIEQPALWTEMNTCSFNCLDRNKHIFFQLLNLNLCEFVCVSIQYVRLPQVNIMLFTNILQSLASVSRFEPISPRPSVGLAVNLASYVARACHWSG